MVSWWYFGLKYVTWRIPQSIYYMHICYVCNWRLKWKEHFSIGMSDMNLPLDGTLAPQTLHIQSNPYAAISYPLCQQCCRDTAHSQYIYINVKPWVPIPLPPDESYVIIIRDIIQRWQDINCTAHFQKCLSMLAVFFSLKNPQNQESIDWKKKNTITRVRWVNCICSTWIFYPSWLWRAICKWINRYTIEAADRLQMSSSGSRVFI